MKISVSTHYSQFVFNTPVSMNQLLILSLQFVSMNSFLSMQLKEGEPKQTIPKDEDPVASCVPHCYTQDVSLACCLPPGAYTIVPSTYQPDCSASFTLSLACRIHRLALFPLTLILSFFRLCSQKLQQKFWFPGFLIHLFFAGKCWRARKDWEEPFRRSVY